MKRIHIILLLVIPLGSCSQEFELTNPNVNELKSILGNRTTSEDVVYLYFARNYDSIAVKREVKYYDYEPRLVCGFSQDFQGGITYTIDQCDEAAGISTTIVLPKIEEDKVKRWVEQIYRAEITDLPNEWYPDKNIYGPVGEEAGCYYELKSGDNNWIIDIYCGC
ncbi:MAG: hypothetical protein HKP06_07285 [Flavobacteriaceae bacterium]|nr:hypothetical protein [Flavobacteriaceae bacterium]